MAYTMSGPPIVQSVVHRGVDITGAVVEWETYEDAYSSSVRVVVRGEDGELRTLTDELMVTVGEYQVWPLEGL